MVVGGAVVRPGPSRRRRSPSVRPPGAQVETEMLPVTTAARRRAIAARPNAIVPSLHATADPGSAIAAHAAVAADADRVRSTTSVRERRASSF